MSSSPSKPAPTPLWPPHPPTRRFHSRLHNRCVAHKGLSSQVQPRLARIKERFQLKMFYPFLLFLGPTTSPLHPPHTSSLFLSSHVIQFLIILLLVAHFSLMLHSHWLASLAAHQELSQSRSFFFFLQWKKNNNKLLLTLFFLFPPPSFALIETRFCPLQPPRPHSQEPSPKLSVICGSRGCLPLGSLARDHFSEPTMRKVWGCQFAKKKL